MPAGPESADDLAPVALLLVSHSRALAAGAVELAAQMAPRVLLIPAGGLDDGGLGTSFDLIAAELERAAAGGRSVVVLTDLGSAVLTTESVLDLADDDVASRVRLADAPFVEGAVAAAVAANGGADLDAVVAAAERTGATFAASPAADLQAGGSASESSDDLAGESLTATAVLRNPLGLHARPAAQLARLAAGFDADIHLNGADASSVLALIGLGVTGGQELALVATGPEAASALTAVVAEIEAGFGET